MSKIYEKVMTVQVVEEEGQTIKYRVLGKDTVHEMSRVKFLSLYSPVKLPEPKVLDSKEFSPKFSDLTDDELRELAKAKQVKGYHNMKRENLIKQLSGDE